MILVDTSAWVEFLRDTGSAVCNEVDRLLGARCAVTDPVVMEVLAGARDDRHLRDLRGLLARAQLLRCESIDYEAAALLYRACRTRGVTVRRLVDCLIGAVAVRHQARILHMDADFDTLAEHTGVEVARVLRR
ncbi:MAG TPA: PIN domain nuclease [Acidimicrobiales bacterium]|nr:PIN domain nuclease [Acidimicrobiales bacterium]